MDKQTKTPLRHRRLNGTYNLRDTGGYPTEDGHHTRWGVLYRSDSLHRLTEPEWERLKSAGVRTVVDLRNAGELAKAPGTLTRFSPIAYQNLPLIRPADRVPLDLEELYSLYIRFGRDSIRTVVAALAEPDRLPAVVHCTAGKDRTGLIVALVLSAVGVTRDAVLADYAATGPLVEPLMAKLRADAARDGLDLTAYERLLECRPEAMASALHLIDSQFGSVPAFFREIGVPPEALERLRSSLVASGDSAKTEEHGPW